MTQGARKLDEDLSEAVNSRAALAAELHEREQELAASQVKYED